MGVSRHGFGNVFDDGHDGDAWGWECGWAREVICRRDEAMDC